MKAKVTNEVVKHSNNFSVQEIIGWLKRLAFSDKLKRSSLKTYSLDRAIIAISRIGLFRSVNVQENEVTCATCGAVLDEKLKTEYHIKHCPYCGQRITWEVGEKKSEVICINQSEENGNELEKE